MRIAIRNKSFVSIVLLVLLFASCDSNGIFDQYTSLSGNVWNLDEPVEFELKSYPEVPNNLITNPLIMDCNTNLEVDFRGGITQIHA